MKFLLSFILINSVVVVYATSRIYGGSDAPEGKYPYHVSLWMKPFLRYKYLCGGSILNKRFILTAGHCLYQRSKVKVVAGTILLKGGEDQTYLSEYMAVHKEYGPGINDIGIVRVNRDIEFNDRVHPINLPSEDFVEVDHPAVFTGWGQYLINGKKANPNRLQQIDLKIIDQERCKQEHKFPITTSHICTLLHTGAGLCFGDSGSPLVVNGTQVGIASFIYSKNCAIGKPDVHTRIYTYLDWIKNEFSKFDNPESNLSTVLS